jgi:cellulose synthase (UDP-forming)
MGWDWWISVPFLAAEMFGALQVLGFLYTIWPRPDPAIVPTEDPTLSPIYILIPTVDEGVEILERTLQGAISARACYLAENPAAEISIVVCNDGRVAQVNEWQEVERLAERLGVLCVTRTVGGGAKAGNIEYARQSVGATGDALIVLFDADMVAEPDFLLKTVPPLADPTIGWVQTGQYYRNRENTIARWADDQQALFYSAICSGKARLNAGFICGTNVVIRASALDEIGGLPQDSITEDIAASLLLHHRGWRGVYLTDVLATGLGPADIAAYFAQQRRWATGVFGVLRRHGRLLFLPGDSTGSLSFAQRIQYLLSCTHYVSGVCNLMYLLVPCLFFYAGTCAVRPVLPGTLFSYLLPYWLLSLVAFRHASGGRMHWRGTALGFGSFPVTVSSLLSVLSGQRVRFVVTPKRWRQVGRSRAMLLPHGLALLICLGGLGLSFSAVGDPLFILLSGVWLFQMALMLAAVLKVGLTSDRRYEPVSSETSPVPVRML